MGWDRVLQKLPCADNAEAAIPMPGLHPGFVAGTSPYQRVPKPKPAAYRGAAPNVLWRFLVFVRERVSCAACNKTIRLSTRENFGSCLTPSFFLAPLAHIARILLVVALVRLWSPHVSPAA